MFKPGFFNPYSFKNSFLSSLSKTDISCSIFPHNFIYPSDFFVTCSASLFKYKFWSLFNKVFSSTFATYKNGLLVNKKRDLINCDSALFELNSFAKFPSSQCFLSLRTMSCSNLAFLLFLANLKSLFSLFSNVSKSAKSNSVSISSISFNGSILPSTWVIFSSSKHLTT